jgi:ABC-2 type transport system ATP-binding protein
VNDAVPSLALEVAGLSKSFGDTVALDGIDIQVEAGTIFALLGPNGAGKTTMIAILTTLIEPDAGTARVAGHELSRDPGAIRGTIGVTGQFSAVDSLLTGTENLAMMAELWHLPRAEGQRRVADLLERFDLGDDARKPAATYSGGMRRRLDLAMTLVGHPSVIFLDEPTTGLDPRSRRTVWRIVRELVDEGVTIFLTTHYLEEADELADDIGVLDRGRLVAQGSSEELKRMIPGEFIQLEFSDAATLADAAGRFPRAIRDVESVTLQIPSDGQAASLHAVLDQLRTASVMPDRASVHSPDLDEVFLALTGGLDLEGAVRP